MRFKVEEVAEIRRVMYGLIKAVQAQIVEEGGLDLAELGAAMCMWPYIGAMRADDLKTRLLDMTKWAEKLCDYCEYLSRPDPWHGASAAQECEDRFKALMQTRGIEPRARNEGTGEMVRA